MDWAKHQELRMVVADILIDKKWKRMSFNMADLVVFLVIATLAVTIVFRASMANMSVAWR